ncbi:MAG: hypothetical protein V4858_06995 [Pseudomonadota bacterium]
MSTPSNTRGSTARRKSAIALLMVAGGLAAALPVQANPGSAPVAGDAANREILPCFKNKTRELSPCFKTRGAPGAIAPCAKTKTGAIAPCVKTKALVTTP